MNPHIDWQFLMIDTRARVYLLWAVLGTTGFLATHFYQQHAINALWTALSLLGLGYMYKVMPLGVRQMRAIFLAWLVPIFAGMCVSGIIFYVHNALTADIMAHLGAFWLAVLAVGYVWNGIVDSPPRTWYWFAAALNLAAGVVCYVFDPFTTYQYLVAAAVTAVSMLSLWLFRSSVN